MEKEILQLENIYTPNEPHLMAPKWQIPKPSRDPEKDASWSFLGNESNKVEEIGHTGKQYYREDEI